MTTIRGPQPTTDARVMEVIRRYWGFDTLRPLQDQAIAAGLDSRDSLLVIPTGGGKSLCYQVPPVLANRTDVVVSPLIALMKDQVDGLRQCGYLAAALHSGMSPDELRETQLRISRGEYRLIFIAPERILAPHCLRMLQQADVRAFAIDEAHCISHWGHDFRPEYRRLAELKRHFPETSLHAFTATATQRVRDDIIRQLGLQNPAVLVGNFDRPNLTYRILPRTDVYGQTLEVINRHKGEAVIVYCISRKDTESMAGYLASVGVKAAHYHAGMDAADRRRTQDDFAEEKLNVVVATVAFGMGIDRSNVRCVIHAAMPKSVEHYQQETGRAGRDGLPAECVLFYSASDAIKWEGLIARSAEEADRPEEVINAMRVLVHHMQRYCNALKCRHKMLVEYFDQPYEQPNCGACDVCLGDTEVVPDSTVVAQKILSCVARVEERFGAKHVTDVLVGANTEMIRSFGHEKLSTYGLLKEMDRKALGNLIYQLVDQELLARTPGDRPILKLNSASWEVLGGRRDVQLMRLRVEGVRKTRGEVETWSGVDRKLFDELRAVRLKIAEQRGVPAYVIFGDAVLRDMARYFPSSTKSLSRVRGVGERKLADLGDTFVSHIQDYCRSNDLPMDRFDEQGSENRESDEGPSRRSAGTGTGAKLAAFQLFAQGQSLETVARSLQRTVGTVSNYLAEYIAAERPERIDAWIDPATYQTVARAVCDVGPRPLRPIFERLDGKIPYESIRLVAAHIESVGLPAS